MKQKLSTDITYLSCKPKIQTFINEIGHMYLFQYLLEDLETHEINDSNDFWVIHAIDGLEHAYNAYLTKSNIDDCNVEIEYNHEA